MRRLLALALLLVMLPVAASANRVNPHRQDALRFSGMEWPTLYLADTATSFRIETLVTGSLSEPGQWAIIAPEGGDWLYQIYVCEPTDSGLITHYHTWWPQYSNVFSYDFIVPGHYRLYAQVTDSATGARYPLMGSEFDIAPDGIHITAEEKAAQIVSEMTAAGISGDYACALWLHDWLVAHATYDTEYHYYSPDGVLLRGKGVCDSYSLAYELLLRLAGISSLRVTNSTHAWNAVQLEGCWYHIDTTWDGEQHGGTALQNRFLQHIYFGMNTALVQAEHGRDYTPVIQAEDLSCNYMVRSDILTNALSEMTAEAQRHLDADEYVFTLPAAEALRFPQANGGSTGFPGTQVYTYLPMAWMMNRMSWESRGFPLTGSITYQAGEKRIAFALRPTATWRGIVTRLADGCAGEADFSLEQVTEWLTELTEP